MKIYYFIFTLSIIILSCSKNDEITGSDEPKSLEIKGTIQKGPFISGSSISIQELNHNLSPTGTIYNTLTQDDFGHFTLSTDVNSDFLEIIATGFYFNEITGNLSESNINLRAIVEANDSSEINVNILTTLTRDRIIYLLQNTDLSFLQVKIQAENEVLNVFNINDSSLIEFETMDMTKQGAKNAALIAVSAILQQNNSVAELSELLSKINIDIKPDGMLDNSEILETIKSNSLSINLSEIKDNLQNRFKALGLSILIPKFEDYIDSDGDGIINKYDDDTFLWKKISSSFPGYGINCIVFNDKMWYLGDTVLNSEDGINWNVVSSNPPWWSSGAYNRAVFKDKMWVIGPAAIWNSIDGENWTLVTDTLPWQDLYFLTSTVFDDKLFLMWGGYHTWSSNDCINWEQITPLWSLWDFIWVECTVFNNKIWIADGFRIGSSIDGINWDQMATNIQDLHTLVSIITFNNKLWIIAENGFVYFSSDGISWTEDIAKLPSNYAAKSIIFRNRLYYIISNEEYGVYCYVNYRDY